MARSSAGTAGPWVGRLRAQAGEGRIGAIIALVVLVTLIYLLIKLVPIHIKKSELSEEVKRAAMEYAVSHIDYDTLVQRIIKEGDIRGIRIDETAIDIQDSKSMIEVNVEYTEVVSMVWGEWTQDFSISKDIPKL